MKGEKSRRNGLGADGALGRLWELIRSARGELATLRRQGTGDDGSTETKEAIANWLYANWYSVPDPIPDARPVGWTGVELVSLLRAAVRWRSRWESGWVAMQSDAQGNCLAGRSGVTRPFRLGDYANLSRPGAPVVPGDQVAVQKRIDWIDEPTGFWGTQSEAGPPSGPFARIYWSVGHDQVGTVLCEVVRVLDELGTRYLLKCPSRAEEYGRVDSLVVYLEKGAWRGFRPHCKRLGTALSPHLRPSIPPFTRRVAPGVAFAEDGAGTQSFGQSRCSALVEGVLEVLDRQPGTRAQGLARLSRSLRNHGIDPRQPWHSRKQKQRN